jgi:hypothetical protein
MSTIFTVTPEMLDRLDPRRAVETFRDLLWAQARRRHFPFTKIHISSWVEVSDGGIDASVDPDALGTEGDELLTRGTGFQIKTGSDCSPWQPSWVHKELFGKRDKAQPKDNLGPAVRRCLDRGDRYVLVCFGVELTEPQLHDALKHLTAAFTACGYEQPKVEVWGQSHLVGLPSPYPSLCLRVAGRDRLGIRSHASWSQDADMHGTLHLGEDQRRFVEEVRECLRGDEVRHVRVVGEAGSGKTRLVLKATEADDLAPLVVYASDGEAFRRSDLLNAVSNRTTTSPCCWSSTAAPRRTERRSGAR